MLSDRRTLHSSLRSTFLCGVALAFLMPMTAHTFNPNEGQEPSSRSTTKPRLPSIAPLIAPMPRFNFPNAAAAAPLANTSNPEPASPIVSATAVAPSVGARRKLVFPETSVPPSISTGNAIAAPATVATVAPHLAPADVATQKLDAQEITPPKPAVEIDRTLTATRSFVAPAPLVAISSPQADTAISVATPEPLGQPPMLASFPASLSALPIESTPMDVSPLSDASKRILSGFPSKLDTIHPKTGKLAINRMNPDLKALAKNPKVESFDSGGLSIKVQRPGLDTNFELNRAYTSLMGGESSAAIETYKNILISEPNNEDALFGVASTYHRIGNIEQARPYYESLLKLNPNHREG